MEGVGRRMPCGLAAGFQVECTVTVLSAKKRARYEHSSWKRPMKDVGSWRCQKILLGILTTGRLMGVTAIRNLV